MPRVPAYNEIHECVGGQVYTALPSYNDIHSTIALYSVLSQAHLNFALHVASMHAYMPSSPFWGSISPCFDMVM